VSDPADTRYLLTWRLGYAGALDAAEAAPATLRPVLVALIRQELPEDAEIERFRAGGYKLLTVNDEFESAQQDRPLTAGFKRALEDAERDFDEGFGDWGTPAQADAIAGVPQSTQIAPATDDAEEKRAYLRVMYGDGRDDGLR